MRKLLFAVVGLLSFSVFAADPCEAPRIRDTLALSTAISQDKSASLAFLKAAGSCGATGIVCDAARVECGSAIQDIITKQAGFDETAWLRDMLLPYNGEIYPASKALLEGVLANDISCNVDVAALNAASSRRNNQATRREGFLSEYPTYVRWAQAAQIRCKEKVAVAAAKNEQATADAAKIAAAVAATKASEEAAKKAAELAAQQKADADKKAADAQTAAQKQAQSAAKAQQEAQDKAAQAKREADAKVAAAQKEAEQKTAQAQKDAQDKTTQAQKEADKKVAQGQKDAQDKIAQEKKSMEDAAAKEKREADAKVEQAKRDAEKAKQDAEAKAQNEKEKAEQKAKDNAEKKVVDERESKIAALKKQKTDMVAAAEEKLSKAKADEAVKRQAALDAVKANPGASQAMVADAATAEKTRIAAEQNLIDTKKKADEIEVDDTSKRSMLSAALYVGALINSGQFGVAGLIQAHLGLWGIAPSEGMASGAEIRLAARAGYIFGTAPYADIETLATVRYFIGRFGIGGGVEFTNIGVTRLGVGASIGLSIIDNPTNRVSVNAHYLPIGTSFAAGNGMDFTRTAVDVELSFGHFSVSILGGIRTLPIGGTIPVQGFSWQVGAFFGGRLFLL